MAVWNDDVLFVHIPKTAGMSVRAYVRDNSPKDTAYQVSGREGLVDHVPIRDIPLWTERAIDSFKLIVAVVRDPYEQQLSQWWHWRDGYARGGRTLVEYTAAIRPDLASWLLEPYAEYSTWYEAHLKPLHMGNRPASHAQHLEQVTQAVRAYGYYEYWLTTGADRELPPNLLIIPFDDVAWRVPQALAPYMRDDAATELDHRNVSRKRDARQYHTNWSVSIIEQRFKWAFDRGLCERWSTTNTTKEG